MISARHAKTRQGGHPRRAEETTQPSESPPRDTAPSPPRLGLPRCYLTSDEPVACEAWVVPVTEIRVFCLSVCLGVCCLTSLLLPRLLLLLLVAPSPARA